MTRAAPEPCAWPTDDPRPPVPLTPCLRKVVAYRSELTELLMQVRAAPHAQLRCVHRVAHASGYAV